MHVIGRHDARVIGRHDSRVIGRHDARVFGRHDARVFGIHVTHRRGTVTSLFLWAAHEFKTALNFTLTPALSSP